MTARYAEAMARRTPHSPAHLDPRHAATEIVERLRGRGFLAYFAGGCVRDELLGYEPKDYDVATDARPEQIRAEFGRTAEVGAAFGVMLVRDFGPAIEVATFRTEGPYSDKRRPDHVDFADAEADAWRRDFTINALFIDPLATDPSRRVIDYVGGLHDLERRTLRAVGDPEARLAEDHLRALRALRFAARYGLQIDPATERAITRHAAELAGVSRERIGEEVRRMMAHPTRAAAAELTHRLGLDRPIFGHASVASEPAVLARLETDDVGEALGAWAIDRGEHEPADACALRWRRALMLSNELTDAVRGMLEDVHALRVRWSAMGVAERKRATHRATFASARRLLLAIDPGAASEIDAQIASLASDGVGLRPRPLVAGEDLIALGLEPGPAFSGILDAVYDAQLEGRVGGLDEARALVLALAAPPGDGPPGG